MENVMDFFYAALPWLAMGLLLAIFFVRSEHSKNMKNREENGEEAVENYGTEGMCLGMCFGTAIGSSFGFDTGMGISLGMLIGLAIGSCIKKDEKSE